MNGVVFVYLIVYASVVAFLATVCVRFVRLHRMPMHLRWELYPVGHESGDRSRYGGSYLERLDWWKERPGKSKVNELKAMIPEMLFLVALFEHNRKLWLRSFPFHFGLYTLVGTLGLVVLGAVLGIAGVAITPGSGIISMLIYYLTIAGMLIGLVLATGGTIGLLHRRLFDAEIRNYTNTSDVINLAVFAVVLLVAWVTFGWVDTDMSLTRSFVGQLLTFDVFAPVGSRALGVEVLLVGLLIAYVPLTHMSHFFTKWFTWHKIRWDDEPNRVGSRIEENVLAQVRYPVSWAAKHIHADGKKNWVDIATEEIR